MGGKNFPQDIKVQENNRFGVKQKTDAPLSGFVFLRMQSNKENEKSQSVEKARGNR